MKKAILSILLIFTASLLIKSQISDPTVSKCIINAGEKAKHLKDYRIQLGADNPECDYRYKVNITLWKNRKYRFTMCTADYSEGDLIISVKDNENRTLISSFDQGDREAQPYVDFTCTKSGIYQLNYDFTDRQPGSGVAVVSMIR